VGTSNPPYPVATIPLLGSLFFGGLVNGEKVWSQPGGPGTIVYPQQQIGEQIGLWVEGCAHWFNSWDVRENAWNPPSFIFAYVVPSAFVLCPLCGYVQRIITPFDLIQDPVANPIIFA
jgi:hypothetical protein